MLARKEILNRFKNEVSSGNILLGVGAGTGITAKSSENGGADLLIIYNSGRYRMAGRGSLAGILSYGDANQIVVEMGNEVLPVVQETPVLAGVNGTDPFRVMDVFLKQLKDQGFSGVQNFPTVGLIDGTFRANLEETGMGYDLEVDMIRKAHELDLLTTPYVFDEEQAKKMAKAGADILVAHMGLTTKGTIGAQTALTLDDCVERIQGIANAGKAVNPDISVICHGGPIAEPEDAEYVIKRVDGVVGFFGASSIERFAAERGIKEQSSAFKKIKK
ncbi:phosphoenolpyruvate hydrolase family protein [Virgibacillus sp. JSM 102003]|uniref:phosphoenolpyruvate hydrolase family protein n=1 Tax=Virgibacillus sp. JSM 102003 TaxID=1562108 RepID=UPI0035C0B7A0